ncbi:MAG: hypothetical protein AUG51_23295 [Acidobacteria bacterium 13_1_20CM_3_53_8]|nr:MAG: hypothetical protein AUG51_23295 [Acidobacteria bacterium 13_1_20CM_3_53_8]
MSETTEEKSEAASGETPESATGAKRVEAQSEERRVIKDARGANRTAIVSLVAVVCVTAMVFLLWWYFGAKSGAGRVVPAPRTVPTPQTDSNSATAAAPSEATIILAPDVAERAGIKIEAVGEQMVAEANAGGATATGVVQANSYRSTPLVSLVGGIVRRVNAELGQSVQRGQVLAVVFSDELATAQSKYLTALAELEEHEKHHRREMQLVEIGAASREELEQATTMMRTAESEVASERQKLLLLGLTPQRIDQLKSPSQISSEVNLTAPIAGTIVNRTVNPGEVIEANREMLRVADLSSVWVIAQVFEQNLSALRTGSGASVTSNAYPGKIFRGHVAYIDPSLDPTTRTAQVRVELANPGQILKIGMYVNINFATIGGSEATAPVIPASAVQNINNQQVVFVTTSDPNRFVMRAVRLAPEANGRFTVIEGLSVGERIVTDGSFMLRAEWLKLHPNGT